MKKDPSTSPLMTRRRLLARVGLAASAAYVAPAMIGLNAAHASGNSGASGGNSGASGGNSGASGGNSGASSGGNSGASRGGNSGASRGRSSRPSRKRQGNGDDLPRWLSRMLHGN